VRGARVLVVAAQVGASSRTTGASRAIRASFTTVATRAASSLTPKPAATTCAISWRLAPSHTPYTNSVIPSA